MSEEISVALPKISWRPLRIWIPILLLPLMVFMRFVPGLVPDGPSMIWMASAFGPFLVGLLVMLWWLLASRARWFERILGVLGVVGAVGIEQAVCHESMRGPLPIVMTIPMAIAAFALGAILFGNRLSIHRTWLAIGLAALGAGYSALIKTDGVWGDFSFGFDWRWNQSAEQKALSEIRQAEKRTSSQPIDSQGVLGALKLAAWPGFRGPQGDSAQRGLRFSDDWTAHPPQEIWRKRLGPAWSSFSIGADRLFTQEQRGENEAVACYDSKTGEPIWSFETPSRFFESLGGLGPRGTPTLSDGSIYALGAEGILVKLDAMDGKLVWKADLKEASGRKEPPMWGFSCSPCVESGVVIVHAGGKGDKGVIAFNVEDGQVAWTAPAGEMSYSTVQKIKLLDQPYLCLLSNTGAHLWEPTTGKSLYNYEFVHQGYRACQAQVIDGNKMLIPAGMGTGTRLVEFTLGDHGLEAKEVWTSKDMKPDYNDILVHDGNIYGFDNAIFACIGLEDGKRKWKGGRYEKGQALLLADSGLILVISEKGELVLLRATSEKHQELGKIAALSDKTWNHPVVVGDRLYVRNAQEAVCYQLATAE
ncbi:MAG: PQQ-binding-like beta-propeller repeat protein [Pirellula sp.]